MTWNILQYQGIAAPIPIGERPESEWHQPWSIPKHTIASIAIAVSATVGQVAPVTPTTVLIEWYQSWSEPSRSRSGLKSDLQQFLAIDPYALTQPENVTEDRWHQPWSNPRVVKRAPYAQTIAYVPVTAAEVITEDKWHHPWTTPTRRIRRIQSSEVTPTVVPTPQTFPPASAVTTLRINRKVLFQSVAAPVFTPPTENITPDKWLYRWSEPVRLKPGLKVSLQQFLAIDPYILTQPERVSEDKWHQPWSTPVRLKRGLGTWLQHVTDINPFPRPSDQTTAASWYIPLSEPVRLKPGLRVSLQQFLAIDPYSLTQPERVSEDKWHEPWAEPVRLPKGLGAWLQAFRAATDIPTSIIPNVTVTISATETNNDVFLGGIKVFASLPARRALVSIVEIPIPGNDPSSIVES